MSTHIFTSAFQNGIPPEIGKRIAEAAKRRDRFAFVASEFFRGFDKTDKYVASFLEMLTAHGIAFRKTAVVDGRMDPEAAREIVKNADFLWLSGGDTKAEYGYFEQYGLADILREHKGVILGMSAGAINMGKTALCAFSSETELDVWKYPALGLADFCVVPHLNGHDGGALLPISRETPFYALCDGAAIVVSGRGTEFFGGVYLYKDGKKFSCNL